MCTFENEHSVLVCDTAIRQVRQAVCTAFGDAVQFTSTSGDGTRVEVAPTVDEKKVFQAIARAAIASAQPKDDTTVSENPSKSNVL